MKLEDTEELFLASNYLPARASANSWGSYQQHRGDSLSSLLFYNLWRRPLMGMYTLSTWIVQTGACCCRGLLQCCCGCCPQCLTASQSIRAYPSASSSPMARPQASGPSLSSLLLPNVEGNSIWGFRNLSNMTTSAQRLGTVGASSSNYHYRRHSTQGGQPLPRSYQHENPDDTQGPMETQIKNSMAGTPPRALNTSFLPTSDSFLSSINGEDADWNNQDEEYIEPNTLHKYSSYMRESPFYYISGDVDKHDKDDPTILSPRFDLDL